MSTKVPESDAVGSSGAENVSQRGVEPLQTVIMQANSVASSNQQTDDISVPHDSSNRKTILSTNHEKHADPSKHYDRFVLYCSVTPGHLQKLGRSRSLTC